MSIFKNSIWATLLVVSILGIASCASISPGGSDSQTANPAQAAALAMEKGDYDRAVKEYTRAAGETDDHEKQRQYRLEAGFAAAQGGDAETAHRFLDGIDTDNLSQLNRARYNLAQREIKIADMSPEEALKQLPKPADGTPDEVARQVMAKRAELHFAAHAPLQGLNALVDRDQWLDNDQAKKANDERIYDKAGDIIGLGVGPDSKSARYANDTTRGWLALADLGQQHFDDDDARDKALEEWQDEYPGHPANRSILADHFNYGSAEDLEDETEQGDRTGAHESPKADSDKVALALPSAGHFKNASRAIQDGFMFAYDNTEHDMPEPTTYDSSDLSARQLASRVKQDDIGVLVGPLAKDKVKAMSKQPLSAPEIALNTPSDIKHRPGFYQFGLTPENEAEAVAVQAHEVDYSRALVLVPEGDWGHRVSSSFERAFKANGGEIIGQQSYNPEQHDHSRSIQSVLKNQSDADFIFVAAQPTAARLIRAQLKYYRAEDLPMVSTSHIYSGQENPDQDIDLNGVHFVDMPWLLSNGGTIKRLRQSAEDAHESTATSYARLFAMGMDAWLLARQAQQNELTEDNMIEGMTGVLSLQPDGLIKRYLGWAEFRNGRPHALSLPSIDDARQAERRLERHD